MSPVNLPCDPIPMIRVDGLSKTFYVHRKAPGVLASLRSLFRRERIPKYAVRDVSFSVSEGEIVGLVGANGAGKTTLVKMLAGVVHPTSGEATVLGFRPWERDDRMRRQISLIMGQKAQLWWDLPAGDGFLLLREIYQIPPAEYRANLDYLSRLLEIEDELNVQIRRLSLGERMKMELIAALLHSPRVVFLDEPTIGLDLAAQRAIREFILEFRREKKPAMILTSHYMEDIESLCERIIILRDGVIVYDGPLDRVLEDYAGQKRIVAQLSSPGAPDELRRRLCDLGVVLDCTATSVTLEVARQDVAAATGTLLATLPVADLAIEEIDIGTVIERILGERGES